jgi:putative tryptophan/tyrosine transport system substrate-binding protein
MTTRRDALMALPLICVPSIARAQVLQKPGSIVRIGDLDLGEGPELPLAESPFWTALSKKGWVIGKNLVVESAYANWKAKRLAGLAEGLVRKRVDVILTNADPPTLAAARATQTIPILFYNVLWPVEQGLINSLARPGRNLTGFALYSEIELLSKQLEFLREVAPTATRLSRLYFGANLLTTETLNGARLDMTPTLEAATKHLGFETRYLTVSTPQDLDTAFSETVAGRAQAIAVGGWPFKMAEVAEHALHHRLPSTFVFRENVVAGGLLAYATPRSEQGVLGSRYIEYLDRLLRGVSPADLPVEQPSRYELVINMKTANALGLTIPKSLLGRADEVIR